MAWTGYIFFYERYLADGVLQRLSRSSSQNPTMSSTPTLFLFFRRGIPLICVTLSLAAILIYPPSAGWALIVAVALLAEVGTTFYVGTLYVAKRRAITRWDGYWLMFLRPFFNFLNMEDRWLRSFCAWNNRRVSKTFKTKRAGKAIALLPHCVQLTKCRALVVEDISSCFGCVLRAKRERLLSVQSRGELGLES